MNKIAKRTTITLSAVGLSSLVRADIAQHQLIGQSDSHATATAINHQHVVLNNLPAGTIIESLASVSGVIDTISSASDKITTSTCKAGEIWTGTQCSPTTVQSGDTGGQGGVVQSTADNTPTGAQASFAPEVTNTIAISQPCITVALPILNNGKNCVDNTQEGGAILVYVKDAVKLLSGTIGGVIVLMIVIAGIQYIISMGNPSGIGAAKKRLTNAITALVLFLMAFAIINFLLPGGIAG